MFSNNPRPVCGRAAATHARDYISGIPEEQITQSSSEDILAVRFGLDQMVWAINPSATLSHPQQVFVRVELSESFTRYFYARDTLGLPNAEFQLDMRLLQIATFVNSSYTPRGSEDISRGWLAAPIAALVGVFSSHPQSAAGPAPAPAAAVLKGWLYKESQSWKEPLISYERDPVRFSDQIIQDLAGLVPESAHVNTQQVHFLRNLLRASILTFFDECNEVGFISANARHLDRLRLFVHYCASCTGR